MKVGVNGHEAYCFTGPRAADPSRPAVVLLHGAGMDHTVWSLVSRHLLRHGRCVIAPDLPGHGRSGGEPLGSVPAMADWVVALLDALGIAQAAVCGHSLGSLVALDAAARHPGRIRALAMVGTAVPMPVSEGLLAAAAANDHAAFEMLTQWGYSKRHAFGGNSNPGVWMSGATLRLFERSRAGVLHADLSACNAYTEGLERAASVACPSLLVLGAEDRLTPVRASRDLQQALPKARVQILPGAGHTLMVEAPNTLLDALRSIL
ncbi:MAG: alpha/beta fold hydrolase [Gammaproteobacteria bacterium]